MSRKFKLRLVQIAVLGLMLGALPGGGVKAQIPDVPKFSDLIVIRNGLATANVYWLGGSGTYTFSTPDCTVLSAPGPGIELPGACATVAAPLTSSGSFINLVCGTGFAFSGPPANTFVVEPAVPGEEGAKTSSVSYAILFAGGVGVLLGDVLEDVTGGAASYPAIAKGIVILHATPGIPNTAHPKLGVCTPTFTVEVVAVVVENPLTST